MSGIAGLLFLDGRPAERAVIERMNAAQAHRGSDNLAVHLAGPVALGHQLLDIGSDGLHVASDGAAITFHGRIDNRADLQATLAAAGSGDAVLALAAYARWGEEFPLRLTGDFACAIWDPRQWRLFCVRDQMGIAPFYYQGDANVFRFASEPKALFAGGAARREPDGAAIAAFLAGLPPPVDRMFDPGIRRLPPGHCCSVDARGVRVHAYWQLEARAERPRRDAPEQFRALLGEAVACRTIGRAPVGAMLSGGLDSSSIACLAAPILARQGRALPTFSLVYDRTPEHNERPYIEAVLERGGLSPHFIAADDIDPFLRFDTMLGEQDGPFLAPNLATSRRTLAAARRAGIRIILDGHGGDEAVSSGGGRLSELAHGARLVALWRELRALDLGPDVPLHRTFVRLLRRHGPGRRLRSRLGRMRAPQGGRRPSGAVARFLAPDPDLRAAVADQFHQMQTVVGPRAHTERAQHLHILRGEYQSYAAEILDRSCMAAGVEGRYPFLDRRLVEFCVSLDAAEKMHGGWSRLILRRAMAGVLPPEVQWRRDKFDFSEHLLGGLIAGRALVDDVLDRDVGGIGAHADVPALRAAFHAMVAAPDEIDGAAVQAIWRTVALALWMGRKSGAGSSRMGSLIACS